MTTEQIIATLREHNEWRRGGDGEMLAPKTIGEAIEAACDALEEICDWRTEYEIVAARLRGQKHPSDNGIISDEEIIPKLERERDEAREKIAALEKQISGLNSFANERYDEILRVRKERDEAREALENLKAASIHTCHDQCKRPMCVLRRERDAERALADRLAEAAMKSSNVIGPPDKVTWSTENEINDAWNCAQSSLSAWKEARSE